MERPRGLQPRPTVPLCGLRSEMNNELNHPPNLERLVLCCIDADFCNQILILQHFSRSTGYAYLRTAAISKIQPKIVNNFAKLNIEYSIQTSHIFHKSAISRRNLDEILSEFREHVPKYPSSFRISENLQNFRKNKIANSVKIPKFIIKLNNDKNE